MKTGKFILQLVIIFFLFSSCNTSRKVIYVQNAGSLIELDKSTLPSLSEMVIKNGDVLMITVSTVSPEAAAVFNPPFIADASRALSASTMTSTPSPLTYLVDDNGTIPFPVIGRISVVGKTKTQIEEFIRKSIFPKYVKEDPIVTLKVVNYKISILGEVARPGVYSTMNDRISIFEALALAGDMTIYGKRDNLLLIRENSVGRRESYRIDITDKNLIESPYYYLQQNDVLYIQPNRTKTNSTAIGSGEYMIFTILGSLLSVTSVVITLMRN